MGELAPHIQLRRVTGVSEQPAARPAAPKGKGRKIAGMTQTQLLIVLGIALVGGAYLLYRSRKKTAAASTTGSTGTGTCADGSAPDANGNCPQSSQDFSGQLATLQQEIAGLQASAGGGSSGGGGVTGTTGGTTGGSTGGSTDGGGVTTPPPPATGGGSNPNLPTGSQQVQRYPAPAGLTARADDSHTAAVSFNATNPPAQSYTVAFYQLNGTTAAKQTVGGVSSGRVSTAVTGLHPSWSYNVSVWANGGAIAPSGASTRVTMPAK